MAWIKRGIGVTLAALGALGAGCETPPVERTISRQPPGLDASRNAETGTATGTTGQTFAPIVPHAGVTPTPIVALSPVPRPSVSAGASPGASAPPGAPLAEIPVGHVGTLAGDGTEAVFETPWGVVVDGEGRIVVADDGANALRRVDAQGRVTTLATGFRQPRGLAIDSRGVIYVADYHNHRVRRVAASGGVSLVAGASDTGAQDGPVETARFLYPAAVAVLPAQGGTKAPVQLFVADSRNHAIRRLGPEGSLWPPQPAPSPSASPSGAIAVSTLKAENGPFDLAGPFGVAVDGEGRVVVADTDHHRIVRLEPVEGSGDAAPTLRLRVIAGTGIKGQADGLGMRAQFSSPMGLAFDKAGNLYVADYYNHCIRKLSAPDENGRTTVSTVAGNGFKGFADGPRLEARFAHPTAVAFDADGNLVVADSGNRRVRKVRLVADSR